MNSKKCTKCDEVKQISEFSKSKTGKYGVKSVCRLCIKQYRIDNKDSISENKRKYFQNNKDLIYQYRNNRKATEPIFKLRANITTLIGRAIRNNGYTKRNKLTKILGCSYDEFIHHLESNEYGLKANDSFINIDHIIPTSSATTIEEVYKLNHYTNIQLLTAPFNQNIKGVNEFNKEDFENHLRELYYYDYM